MDIQEKEVLIAEIERFKEEALNMHIVQVLAHTYTITSLFDYSIDSDGSVIWYKAQACQLWDFWQAAKAQAVPEGFVLINAESLAFHAKSIRMFNDGDSEHQREEIEDHVCSIEAMIEVQEPADD